MRSLETLLTELGDCYLSRFIEQATDANQLLTRYGRETSAEWAYGYLAALKDLGRISAEEFTAMAPEPRRLALAKE